MIELKNPEHFDLKTIMNSGQCFRIFKVGIFEGEDDIFDVLSMNHWVRVFHNKTNNIYSFDCDENEFAYWENYFDLNTDYQPFFDAIEKSNDEFLKSAAAYANGMRILRQDYWETIISFIISQNNNIPRIKKSIEAFCRKFGTPPNQYGEVYYSFPPKENMLNVTIEELQEFGLGYRDSYIYNACHCFNLPNPNDLLQLTGVGPKVKSCIELFGCHKMDSYPKDTWIKKMIDEVYGGCFDVTPYKGFEGFIQQLQFYYYRHLKKGI